MTAKELSKIMKDNLQLLLNDCTGDRIARRIIHDVGYTVHRDDSREVGCFSVWLWNGCDALTRVYRDLCGRYWVQRWH